MSAVPRERLADLLTPVLADTGLDLEDVQLTPAGRRRLLRVVVDRDGGVPLDEVAAISGVVSAALDRSDALGGQPYTLEVSSPGVDRPLTEPRHWRRASGRLVRASLADGSEVTGRLAVADEDGVLLHVDGSERRLSYREVTAARVQVEFSRTKEA